MKSAFNYALKGITSFSTVPLKIASVTGVIFCIIAIAYMFFTIINHFISPDISSGYSSIMCVLLFGFGLVLLVLGIIDEYLAEIYLEIKDRPKFIIKESSDGLKK